MPDLESDLESGPFTKNRLRHNDPLGSNIDVTANWGPKYLPFGSKVSALDPRSIRRLVGRYRNMHVKPDNGILVVHLVEISYHIKT